MKKRPLANLGSKELITFDSMVPHLLTIVRNGLKFSMIQKIIGKFSTVLLPLSPFFIYL